MKFELLSLNFHGMDIHIKGTQVEMIGVASLKQDHKESEMDSNLINTMGLTEVQRQFLNQNALTSDSDRARARIVTDFHLANSNEKYAQQLIKINWALVIVGSFQIVLIAMQTWIMLKKG